MRTIHTPLFAPFRGALIIIGVQRYNFFINLQAQEEVFSLLTACFLCFQGYNYVPEASHCGPDERQSEELGEACVPVVGDVHGMLHPDGFRPEGGLATAEGVHQEFVDAGLHEAVQAGRGDAEGLCQVVGEACDVGPEVELLLFALRIGDGVPAPGVSEGGAVDVGHVAHASEEEGYLNVFAAVCVGVEELWELVHGPAYPFVAVEGCAEMDGRSFSRHQDVGEEVGAVED